MVRQSDIFCIQFAFTWVSPTPLVPSPFSPVYYLRSYSWPQFLPRPLTPLPPSSDIWNLKQQIVYRRVTAVSWKKAKHMFNITGWKISRSLWRWKKKGSVVWSLTQCLFHVMHLMDIDRKSSFSTMPNRLRVVEFVNCFDSFFLLQFSLTL